MGKRGVPGTYGAEKAKPSTPGSTYPRIPSTVIPSQGHTRTYPSHTGVDTGTGIQAETQAAHTQHPRQGIRYIDTY